MSYTYICRSNVLLININQHAVIPFKNLCEIVNVFPCSNSMTDLENLKVESGVVPSEASFA